MADQFKWIRMFTSLTRSTREMNILMQRNILPQLKRLRGLNVPEDDIDALLEKMLENADQTTLERAVGTRLLNTVDYLEAGGNIDVILGRNQPASSGFDIRPYVRAKS